MTKVDQEQDVGSFMPPVFSPSICLLDILSLSPQANSDVSSDGDLGGDTLCDPQPGPSQSQGDVLHQFDPLVHCDQVSDSSSEEESPTSSQSRQQDVGKLYL